MIANTHKFSPEFTGSQFCRQCGLHCDDIDHTEEPPALLPTAANATEAELLDRINKILTDVGSFAHCRGCARGIFWVKNKRGSNVPYTPEGINHFIDCPNANEFRKSVSK